MSTFFFPDRQPEIQNLRLRQKGDNVPLWGDGSPIFLTSVVGLCFSPNYECKSFLLMTVMPSQQCDACVFFKKIIHWGWPEVVCKSRPETRKGLTLKNTSKLNKTIHKLFPHAAFTAALPPSWDWLLRSQPDWTAPGVNGVFFWHSCYTYQGPRSLLPAARPKWATRLVCDWQQQPRKKKQTGELCWWCLCFCKTATKSRMR